MPQHAVKARIGEVVGKGVVAALVPQVIAEDQPEASFAGQQSTFLNIQGEDELLQAVKKCWASLYNQRAIYYRSHSMGQLLGGSIAVIIQDMIDANTAGVLFTSNPVTGNTNEIIIEAAFGLGEAVVSGAITPDHIVINKNGTLIDTEIAKQEWGYFRVDGSTVAKAIDYGGNPCLSADEALELARLGQRIEQYYRMPMDVEWAIDDKIHILQARPITTAVARQSYEVGNKIMDSISKTRWVKPKERHIDVFIQSVYNRGQRAKYLEMMDDSLKIGSRIALSDGRLFYDGDRIEASRCLFRSKGAELANYARSLTKSFMYAARDYEAWLRQQSGDYATFLDFHTRMVPYAFAISIILESVAQEIISAELPPGATYLELIIPNKQSLTAEEYVSRLSLAATDLSGSDYHQGLESHLERFQWISCYRITDNPLTRDELVDSVEQLAHRKPATLLSELKHQQDRALNRADQILETLPDNAVALTLVMRENAWVRTYRRELMSRACFSMRPVLKSIASGMELRFSDLCYLTCGEIEQFLQDGAIVHASMIEQRKESFAFVVQDEKEELLSGTEAEQLHAADYSINQLCSVSENCTSLGNVVDGLSGITACSGTAQGLCSVMSSQANVHDFVSGTILVPIQV